MKKSKVTLPLSMRVLLLVAIVLALSSLVIPYCSAIIGHAWPGSASGTRLVPTTFYGYQLFTVWFVFVPQLAASGILFFGRKTRGNSIMVLAMSIFQLAFIWYIVSFEMEFHINRGYTESPRIQWGYFQMILASLFVIIACILSFRIEYERTANPHLLDDQL